MPLASVKETERTSAQIPAGQRQAPQQRSSETSQISGQQGVVARPQKSALVGQECEPEGSTRRSGSRKYAQVLETASGSEQFRDQPKHSNEAQQQKKQLEKAKKNNVQQKKTATITELPNTVGPSMPPIATTEKAFESTGKGNAKRKPPNASSAQSEGPQAQIQTFVDATPSVISEPHKEASECDHSGTEAPNDGGCTKHQESNAEEVPVVDGQPNSRGEDEGLGDASPTKSRSKPRGSHLHTSFPAISSPKSGKYQTLSKARGLHVKLRREEDGPSGRFAELKGLRHPDEGQHLDTKSPASSVTLDHLPPDDPAALDLEAQPQRDEESAPNTDSAQPTADEVAKQTLNTIAAASGEQSQLLETTSSAAKKKKKTLNGTQKKKKKRAAVEKAEKEKTNVDTLASLFIQPTPANEPKEEEDHTSVSTGTTELIQWGPHDPTLSEIYACKVEGDTGDGTDFFFSTTGPLPNTRLWLQRGTENGTVTDGHEYKPRTDDKGCPTSRHNNIFGFDDDAEKPNPFHNCFHPASFEPEVKDKTDETKQSAKKKSSGKGTKRRAKKNNSARAVDGIDGSHDNHRDIVDGEGNVKVIGKRTKRPGT